MSESIFWFAFISVHVVFATGIVAILGLRDKRHKIERNIQPAYQEICGARIGSLRMTRPLVRFSIYQEFIVISGIAKAIMEIESIQSIRCSQGLASKTISIIHSKPGVPQEIEIYTRNKTKICAMLRDIGIPFQEL